MYSDGPMSTRLIVAIILYYLQILHHRVVYLKLV